VRLAVGELNRPSTVGEAKDAFQKAYGRPVGPMSQSFVSEMLSSITLAMASPNFQYTRVFAFGFQALCDNFLNGVGEDEKANLKESLCKAVGLDVKQIDADAETLKEQASAGTEEDLLASDEFKSIAEQRLFKYSYPFGAGMLSLMPLVDVEPSEESITRWTAAVGLRPERLIKDWRFFENAIEKLAEVRQMMMEMQAAAKRKEASKLKAEAERAAAEAAEAESEAEA